MPGKILRKLVKGKSSTGKKIVEVAAATAIVAAVVEGAKSMHEKGYDKKALKLLKDAAGELKKEAKKMELKIKKAVRKPKKKAKVRRTSVRKAPKKKAARKTVKKTARRKTQKKASRSSPKRRI